MRTYYIYKATNNVNEKIYIGCTCRYKQRIAEHLKCYPQDDCEFHRAILEIGAENFVFEIIDETDDSEYAYFLEKMYIEYYNSYYSGYNSTKGGKGASMWNVRPIICFDLKGNYIKKYESAAQAERIDGFDNVSVLISCKNQKRTCKGYMFMFEDDYLENGVRKYEKPKNACMKRIVQCDLDGNYIATYESVSIASKETNTLRTRISSNLILESKSANGYIFVYEEDFPIKDMSIYRRNKKGRKVAQVDPKTNEIIKVFDRISDAGAELGVSYKSIHKVVDKETRTAYGYKWISQ